MGHLRRLSKEYGLPAPPVVWVRDRADGRVTAVLVDAPDVDRERRRNGADGSLPPSPWGADPVDVSPECAADAISEAVFALGAISTTKARVFYVTAGLFPDDEDLPAGPKPGFERVSIYLDEGYSDEDYSSGRRKRPDE
jgi:hypothetical protein